MTLRFAFSNDKATVPSQSQTASSLIRRIEKYLQKTCGKVLWFPAAMVNFRHPNSHNDWLIEKIIDLERR
jgi:hypothetical protein